MSDNYGTKISNIFRINLIDSDEAPKFNHSDSTTFYRIPKNTLSAPIGSYDSEIAFEKVYVSGIEDIEENGGYLQNLLPLRSGKYLLTGNVINRSIRDSPDYVAVVLDSNLNKLWTKSFGGNEKDFHTNAVELNSGSFLIGGSSDSPPSGSKVSNSFGGMDFWLICVDQNGSKLWDRSYGGTGDEKLEKILPTADGGFLLIGNSDSNKSHRNHSTPLAMKIFGVLRLILMEIRNGIFPSEPSKTIDILVSCLYLTGNLIIDCRRRWTNYPSLHSGEWRLLWKENN